MINDFFLSRVGSTYIFIFKSGLDPYFLEDRVNNNPDPFNIKPDPQPWFTAPVCAENYRYNEGYIGCRIISGL